MLNKAKNVGLYQCCPTFLTPRAAHQIIMKPRATPVSSKVTTKICSTLIYCICVIIIFWNPRLSIMYVHATFDKFYPTSVTLKYVTFSTYKLAIAKYSLNFYLMYNHLFILYNKPLNFVKL